MEHWQFLIQKQGDRSWIPIESPNIEIVEGQYRVLARSDLNNIDLEVRITHTSTIELPPKREIQRRSRRTNSEGLLVVIPFTYLKPGVWELCCSSDLMSHFVSQPWLHCVELEVLPKVAIEVRREEEFPVFTDELLKQEDIIEQPICPVWLKGEKAEQILQNLIEIALPDSELPFKDDKLISDFPVQTPEPLLKLKLQEEIYTTCWGQTLTINGRVEQKETTDLDLSLISNYERVYGGEIRIELRSPQDSKIIRRVRQSLPEKLIPFHIRCSIEVPEDCESKLILGEISLYGVLKIDGNTTLLTHQFFTITADVTELLAIRATTKKNESDTVENQPASSASLVSSEAKKLSTPLDLKLFNLVKTPQKAKSLLLQASPNKSLPQKMNPRSRRKSAAISPQLPRFVQSQNPRMSSTAVWETSSELESNRNKSTFSQVIRNTTFPYLRRLKASQDKTEDITPDDEPVESQEHTTELQNEDEAKAAKSVVEDTQSQNDSFDEDAAQLAKDDTQPQEISFHEDATKPAKDDGQLQDISFAKLVICDHSQYITIGSPNISPLIRKWMQTQGYSLPEPINLQNQDYDTYDTYVVASKDDVSDEVNKETGGASTAGGFPGAGVWRRQGGQGEPALREGFPEQVSGVDKEDKGTGGQEDPKAPRCGDWRWGLGAKETGGQENKEVQRIMEQTSSPLPSPLSPHPPLIFSGLLQEIVVDDGFNEAEAETFKNQPSKQEEESVSDVSVCLSVVAKITEPLPVPQLHFPGGEFISGKSVRIRVQLASASPQVVVKLWVEDCQTRWLIDDPRWLTNLLPNSAGGLEEVTHLIVPFGCLEIRLEAIAVDTVTQQESHKVSIQRTVIPPGLPTLQLDEVLGI